MVGRCGGGRGRDRCGAVGRSARGLERLRLAIRTRARARAYTHIHTRAHRYTRTVPKKLENVDDGAQPQVELRSTQRARGRRARCECAQCVTTSTRALAVANSRARPRRLYATRSPGRPKRSPPRGARPHASVLAARGFTATPAPVSLLDLYKELSIGPNSARHIARHRARLFVLNAARL